MLQGACPSQESNVGRLARCGRPSVSRAKACFQGGFEEDVGHRIVSAVTVHGGRTDCGMVAETIEDLAAHAWSQKGFGSDVAEPFGSGQRPVEERRVGSSDQPSL